METRDSAGDHEPHRVLPRYAHVEEQQDCGRENGVTRAIEETEKRESLRSPSEPERQVDKMGNTKEQKRLFCERRLL